jgi:hypothetical protein
MDDDTVIIQKLIALGWRHLTEDERAKLGHDEDHECMLVMPYERLGYPADSPLRAMYVDDARQAQNALGVYVG